jgi:hypothetical protein
MAASRDRPNHPVAAMPMVAEVLTEHVEMSRDLARRLLKLVCYHDLVSDVLGKGRDEHQIIDVADDEKSWTCFFALARRTPPCFPVNGGKKAQLTRYIIAALRH